MRARFAAAAVTTAVVLLSTAAVADAHIQVRPTEAAPLDPVLWTVLVPNEGEDPTRRIELQVPAGVIPFSFNDVPGWKRTLKLKEDQSIERIVWEGELASDGLAELSFLATTPETEGRIAWKALQVYEGERVVRWIGDEGAEEPASFTTISADAPRQNAGGEGAEPGAEEAAAEPVAATPVAATSSVDDGGDALPVVLGAVALAVALLALVLAVRLQRRHADAAR